MAEGTPESGQEGTFSCFAREFPDLVLENVCTHFTVREFTRWGRCCKMMNAIAQQDLFWARRFRERNWDLEPLPIRGEELLDRWVQSSKAAEHMTTKEIKADLQERSVSTNGLFERPDFVGALQDARTALRCTMIATRPMRGVLLRHFVGLNASWDYGWRERYVEVADGIFSVFEDPAFLRPIVGVSLREELEAGDTRICFKLEPSKTPDRREHCFKITNLGVDVAFDAQSDALCQAWMHKILLHATGRDREAGIDGPRWKQVGLERGNAGAMTGLLRRLGLRQHVMQPEHVTYAAQHAAGERAEEEV